MNPSDCSPFRNLQLGVLLPALALAVGCGKPANVPTQGPGGESDPAERVTIEAHVSKGTDPTKLPGVAGPEYRIEVAVLNTGPEPIRCDDAEAAFLSDKGALLKVTAKGTNGEPIVLSPNKPTPVSFSTARYTADLIHKAQGSLLVFSLTIKSSGTNLLGPRVGGAAAVG